MPFSMWDLSSPARDQTQVLAVNAWNHNHWTTREFPLIYLKINKNTSFIFFTRKQHFDCVVMDVNWTYGDNFTVYT